MPNLEDFFNEIVRNVLVEKINSAYGLIIRFPGTDKTMNLPPLLLVDGVPVFDVDKFLSIPILEIEKMDVINNYYILGETKYGGMVNLITKKKNFASLIDISDQNFFELTGYTNNCQFNEMKYGDQGSTQNIIPDFRNTLYWTSSITTNENGEANVSFYTSDEKGKFLITLEGITPGSEPAKSQLILEVE